MAWSSRGGDIIHWYSSDEAELAVCGGRPDRLPFYAYSLTCSPCQGIVAGVPSDLSDTDAIEEWLSA